MPYNLIGVHDGKRNKQAFDGLGLALVAAIANIDAGWEGVKIECPDNTALKEGLIRAMHDVVQAGGVNA